MTKNTNLVLIWRHLETFTEISDFSYFFRQLSPFLAELILQGDEGSLEIFLLPDDLSLGVGLLLPLTQSLSASMLEIKGQE